MSPARAASACLVFLICAACGDAMVRPDEAREAIAASARFQAAQTLSIRPQYCAATQPPGTAVSRLGALQDAGAIRVERRPAGPEECRAVQGAAEAVLVTLTPTGQSFHPKAVSGRGGWEFELARRKLLSVGAVTYNQEHPPTIAHVQYRWAWLPNLLGQLLQVDAAPQSASAAFRLVDGEWRLADIGF
jgi:hypothetical protein